MKEDIFAKDYKMYQELNISSGNFLSEYKASDLKSNYKSVDKRKFWGWNISKKASSVPADFIYETIFSYYNNGTTAFDYSYKSEITDLTKFSISATGNIGLNASKNKTGFKNGLDASLKIEGKYESNKTIKETTNLSLKVDPNTQVNVYLKGEGKLTNGVAALYRLWFRTSRGGFEYFEVTTIYTVIEKVSI